MSKYDHPSFKFKPADIVLAWDYLPEPPFDVHWACLDDLSRAPVGIQCRALPKAIKAFFNFGYPMRPGWAGRIVDDSGRTVLLWSATQDALRDYGADGYISGVEAVFRVMIENDLPNMVDAQIWADRAAAQ